MEEAAQGILGVSSQGFEHSTGAALCRIASEAIVLLSYASDGGMKESDDMTFRSRERARNVFICTVQVS